MIFKIPSTAKYLENLYEDTMDISQSKIVTDVKTGISTNVYQVVKTGVKCGLSFKNNYNIKAQKPANEITRTPIIFCDFKTDIKTADILDVTTKNGDKYRLITGEISGYHGSHIQVTCSRYENEF